MGQIKQALNSLMNELDYTFKGRITEITIKVVPSVIRDFNIEVREELGNYVSLDNGSKTVNENVTFVGFKCNGVKVTLVEDKNN